MDERIDKGGIKHVSTNHSAQDGLHSMMTFVHHELDTPQAAELARALEAGVMDIIKAFAAR